MLSLVYYRGGTHLLILEPHEVLGREDKPELRLSLEHADVLQGQPALAYNLPHSQTDTQTDTQTDIQTDS